MIIFRSFLTKVSFGGAGGNRTLVQNVINIPSTSVARLQDFLEKNDSKRAKARPFPGACKLNELRTSAHISRNQQNMALQTLVGVEYSAAFTN